FRRPRRRVGATLARRERRDPGPRPRAATRRARLDLFDLRRRDLTNDDLGRQDLVLDALLVVEEVGIGLRQDDSNAVREREPRLFAHRVQLMREVVNATLLP